MAVLSYQWNNYTCGLHAFSNAVKVLGVELDYDVAKGMIGTSYKDGTTPTGIIRGLEKLGLKHTVYKQSNPQSATIWLWKWAVTCPIIVLLDGYLTVGNSHWATVTGRTNGKVILVDPTANVENGENGVYILSRNEMAVRWKRRLCYAIRVSK